MKSRYLLPAQVGFTEIHTRLISQLNLVLQAVGIIEVSQLNTLVMGFFKCPLIINSFDHTNQISLTTQDT